MQRQGVDVEVSLDGVHGVEFDVEEEEDESVQSWTQTITQPSDARYHPLDHTCRSCYWSCYWRHVTAADTLKTVSDDIFSWQ